MGLEAGSAVSQMGLEDELDAAHIVPSAAEESVRIPDWFQNDTLPVWNEIRMLDVIAVGMCLPPLLRKFSHEPHLHMHSL